MNWFKDRGFLWWLRLVVMVGLTGFNFALALWRWGIADSDPYTRLSALIVASCSELMLGVALWLFADAVYSDERSWRNARWWVKLLWWGGVWVGCMAISLYVNYTYFSTKGETLTDLGVRAGLPMAFLIGFSVLPVKKKRLTKEQVAERGEVELEKLQWQQRIEEQRNAPLRLEQERKAAAKRQRDQEEDELLDMIQIALDAGMDISRYKVRIDAFEEKWNQRGLQRALEGLKLWPPVRETLGKAPADDEQFKRTLASLVDPVRASAATSEGTQTTSGSRRTMLNAAEIRERWLAMGITYSEQTIDGWMEPRCKHPYALKNTRKFPPSNPRSRKAFERRASLDSISQVERKILADRDAKVTPFPTRQLTQEPAQEPTRQVTQGVAKEPTQKPTQQNAYDLLAAE